METAVIGDTLIGGTGCEPLARSGGMFGADFEAARWLDHRLGRSEPRNRARMGCP
jgi:hypothetical protein